MSDIQVIAIAACAASLFGSVAIITINDGRKEPVAKTGNRAILVGLASLAIGSMLIKPDLNPERPQPTPAHSTLNR